MSVAEIATSPRGLSESHISTLESLYEAAGAVNFTPGWIPRKKPILWVSRGPSSCRRIGLIKMPKPDSMLPAV